MKRAEKIRKQIEAKSIEIYGLNILDRNRQTEYVKDRQSIIYLLFHRYGFTFRYAGVIFGFSRENAYYCVKKVENEIKTYKDRLYNVKMWDNAFDSFDITEEPDNTIDWLKKQISLTDKWSEEDISILNGLLQKHKRDSVFRREDDPYNVNFCSFKPKIY